MKKFFRNNSLTIVLITLFSISIVGQFFKGFSTYNEERSLNQQEELSYSEYFHSGHFISSVSENMESEFLQMALFVYLTMCLYQKGSAESKKLPEEQTEEDKKKDLKENLYSYEQRKKYPVFWRLYENSLSLTLILLFLCFFFLHAYGSLKFINSENMAHHKRLITFWDVFKENEFWFESFQNWQSEFFSIAIMSLLSIFLRQKDSSQSKKIIDSHDKTGSD